MITIRLCLALIAIGLFLTRPGMAAGQELVMCTAASPTVALCSVSEPDVRMAEVAYPHLRFIAGDRVTVSAAGCVQTGGTGRTWKRYADPQGDDSDRSYFGSFWIPGSMPTPERFQPEPVILNIEQPGVLHLRYADDNYGDNGYYGRVGLFGIRDDGTGGQCRNLGNAVVTIRVERLDGPPLVFGPEPNPSPPGIEVEPHESIVSSNISDQDEDGLKDSREAALAERFAPIFFYEPDEPNLPTRVETFLQQTQVGYFDAGCGPVQVVLSAPIREEELSHLRYASPCSTRIAESGRDRSGDKQHSFFLLDVPESARRGSDNPADWTTYVHAYPNQQGGVTLQYWRFHAFNTGHTVLGVQLGFHGGDWEGVQITLGPGDQPLQARYLSHNSIERHAWPDVPREGERMLVHVERGGHASSPLLSMNTGLIRQETHSGGVVAWPGRGNLPGGGLTFLGEKTIPFRPFLRFAGLWGSPGFNFVATPLGKLIPNFSSGYWGPAFNETELRADGFVTAWCEGTADPARALGNLKECFAFEQ